MLDNLINLQHSKLKKISREAYEANKGLEEFYKLGKKRLLKHYSDGKPHKYLFRFYEDKDIQSLIKDIPVCYELIGCPYLDSILDGIRTRMTFVGLLILYKAFDGNWWIKITDKGISQCSIT